MNSIITVFLVLFSFSIFGQRTKISPSDSTYFSGRSYSPYKYKTFTSSLKADLKDSLENGDYKVFYDNQHKLLAMEGIIRQNKKQGKWTTYFENGNVAAIQNFKNGKLNGSSIEYDLVGMPTFEGQYTNDKLNGTIKTHSSFQHWYGRMGRMHNHFGTVTYLNDSREGPADYWTREHTIHVICNFKNNQMDGKVIYKNEFHELLKIQYWVKGKLLSEEKFENKSYETTYTYNPYITYETNSSVEQIKENLQKLDSCHNLHRILLFNSSKNDAVDSLIRLNLLGISNLKHLTSVELRGKGFKSIPPVLFLSKNLKKITLNGTSISILPEEITALDSLQTLEIINTQFNDIESVINTISKLPNLRVLELSSSFESIPKNIHKLRQIEALYLIRYYSNDGSLEFPIHPNLFRMQNLKVLEIPPNIYYEPEYKLKFKKKMPNCFLSANENCFAPSVNISLANHTTKPINEMKIGDIIIAYDISKKELDTAIVEAVHIHSNRDNQLIEVTLNDNVETKINCTENHPFRTSDNQWLDARELKVGDELILLIGMELKAVSVKTIRNYENSDQVFNISTSKKNYFANGILVHNK